MKSSIKLSSVQWKSEIERLSDLLALRESLGDAGEKNDERW